MPPVNHARPSPAAPQGPQSRTLSFERGLRPWTANVSDCIAEALIAVPSCSCNLRLLLWTPDLLLGASSVHRTLSSASQTHRPQLQSTSHLKLVLPVLVVLDLTLVGPWRGNVRPKEHRVFCVLTEACWCSSSSSSTSRLRPFDMSLILSIWQRPITSTLHRRSTDVILRSCPTWDSQKQYTSCYHPADLM